MCTHAGLPWVTSSAATKISGGVTPAARSACVAYALVAEVQRAHTAFGRLEPGSS